MLASHIRALWSGSRISAVPGGPGSVEGYSGTITADEVLEADDARYAAQTGKDFAALERLLGDELVFIHSSTVVDGKASLIESIRSGAVTYHEMRRADATVRTYGAIAIITGRCSFDVTVKGQPMTLNLLFHGVWAKRAAGVQLVSWQATRLPA